MTKLMLICIVLFCMKLNALSQSNSAVTLSYQHLNQHGNHGIGAGLKTNIWKNAVILADAKYYFRKYHGIFKTNYQKEYYSRYAALNVNLGYPLPLSEKFNLLPFAGIGLFYENINGYISSKGSNVPGFGAPYYVSIDDNPLVPVANIGVLIEYYLTEQFFLVGGAKSQIDVYDGRYNDFAILSFGIGYRF